MAKAQKTEMSVKLDISFEEALKQALNTPLSQNPKNISSTKGKNKKGDMNTIKKISNASPPVKK